ncbi:MAG: ribosomal protein S18-alanine N-acetyltransferase [Miniphocaeibacter sp.]|uniref:ribosomal protein S18-alanine N-acetyltransferase n=1 Tax=Miniphocaeibacter sp. TaxID=3100973 RepID=UPI0017B35A70|nr:ribosomal protein S18-alanine N-acetyltransferase [Gallicola sp.]
MFNIRKMVHSDIDAISELERKIFKNPWSYESFKSALNNEYAHYFVVEKNNELIGYFGMLIVLDECQIHNIGIIEEEQNQGYGNKIMEYIINYCKENNINFISLEVREYNFKAIHLYSKYGFKKMSRISGYYTNPSEDGLLMRLDLGDKFERIENSSYRNVM